MVEVEASALREPAAVSFSPSSAEDCLIEGASYCADGEGRYGEDYWDGLRVRCVGDGKIDLYLAEYYQGKRLLRETEDAGW